MLSEERADRGVVALGGGMKLLAAGVRQLRIGDAQVGRARRALHEAGLLEPLEKARDPRRSEHQAAREIDALHPAALGLREDE